MTLKQVLTSCSFFLVFCLPVVVATEVGVPDGDTAVKKEVGVPDGDTAVETEGIVCQKGQQKVGGECATCPKGSFCSEDEGCEKCLLCEAGKYGSKYSSMPKNEVTWPVTCTDCSAGRYADQEGTVKVFELYKRCKNRNCSEYDHVTCPVDGVEQKDGACKCCPPGKYQDKPGQTSCHTCPKGKYFKELPDTKKKQLPRKDPHVCQDCVSGTYSSEDGAIESCTKCEAGKFQDASGETSCKNCPQGTYREPASSAKSCVSCPKGKTTDNEGSTKKGDCKAEGRAFAEISGGFVGRVGAKDRDNNVLSPL